MSKRCPKSRFVGIPRLHDWRFIINQHGVVQSGDDHVWGLVYNPTEDDEATLDINEDVPFSYVKKYLEITLWDANIADDVDVSIPPGSFEGRSISGLVYVDEERTDERLPRE